MIIIIDNYDSFTYNLYQSMAQFHPAIHVIRNDKVTLEEIKNCAPSGIVLSPGPGRPEDAGICIELIRALPDTVPLLGVCLGHQAIAIAFGGKVIQALKIVHGKPDTISHHGQGLYQQLPAAFIAGRYHSLIVDRATLPKTLLVEAETADGLIMGMRHVHRPVYGVQFHPESILTPAGDLLLQNFIKKCMHTQTATEGAALIEY